MQLRKIVAAFAVCACVAGAYAQDATKKEDSADKKVESTKVTAKDDKAATGTEKKAEKAEMKTLPSGTKYQELQVGTGKEAKAGDSVTAHYTGRLQNGTVFDTSLKTGEPLTFALKSGPGGVIQGWVEGVAGMKEGGKRKLVIPSSAGYGDRGMPPVIPPKATLIFDVELVKVN